MDSFNTFKIIDNEIIEQTSFLDELETKSNLVPDEKSGVRKQIEVFKEALAKTDSKDVEKLIYKIKVAKLKFKYFIWRKMSENEKKREIQEKYKTKAFGDFIEQIVNKFLADLSLINKETDHMKKNKNLIVAKKVFKDFLNGVIVKSYTPKNYGNQK